MNTHPQVLVDVDGVPVSGAFFDRLVKLTIVDNEGIQSDSLQLVFADGPPFFDSPRRGAIVTVTLQLGLSAAFVGAYVVDHVMFECLPYQIKVGGHSGDLRDDMTTNKTRQWDDASVKDIVTEIADDHGLEPKISEVVSAHVYEWIGQQDESDMNFLERLARRHAALFTIKNAALLWLERGAGKTASGESVPAETIPPTSIIRGSCRVIETDVDRYKTVKAYWQDRAGAKRQEVVVEVDPEATGEHVLRDPYASKEEAEAAAKSAAQEMLRGLIETICAVEGRPALMAGQPIRYAGVRPVIDGQEFILEKVTHTYSKSTGLRTTFRGKLRAA